MNSRNRIWLLVVAVVGLGVVALGYLLGIAPKFEEIKVADAARAEAESTNALYEDQLAKLKKDFESIDEVHEDLEELAVQLPYEADYETFLALVDALAVGSGARTTGFAWNTPAIISSDSVADIVQAASGTGDTSGATDSAEEPVAPVVSGIAPDGSLVGIPWTATIRGSYESLRTFMFGLQRTDRLFAVTSYTIALPADDGSGGSFVLTVSGMNYVFMNSKALAEAKAEAEEAEAEAEEAAGEGAEQPESTPTPTSSPTPTSTPKP